MPGDEGGELQVVSQERANFRPATCNLEPATCNE